MTRSVGSGFPKGDPRAVVAGRKGGKVTAAQRGRTKTPYRGTIIDLMDAAGCTGSSWLPWRAFWKGVYALPMTDEELAIFRRHTERDPPTEPVSEAVMCIGRRGGKTSNAALCAVHAGISFDRALVARGELVTVPLLAKDRLQARQLIRFVNALCDLPGVRPFLSRTLRSIVELKTGINLEITTASFRGTRGYTSPCIVADEIAFWRTEDESANPDVEVLAALRPTLATIPNSLLLMLSSPYAAAGELFQAVERSFGQEDSYCLVWNSDSLSMNPNNKTLRRDVERRWQTDPIRAASEYGRDGHVTFRSPIEAFVAPEVVAASTVAGRLELPPLAGIHYVAFADPSGGVRDSFALSLAHLEDGGRAVLDLIRERKPPFSPDSVVAEYSEVLRTYGCADVTADKYAAQWVVEAFERHGIRLLHSALPKSDLYAELIGPLNSGRIELLDNPMLHSQLLRLERRTGTGGRDRIDHKKGGKDDLINSAAGALTLALGASGKKKKQPVVWSLGAGHVGGASSAEPKPHKAALETIAAEYKERGLKDPCKVPGSVTTRHFYDYPKTPPGWEPGDPLYGDSASPEFRQATGGGQ